MLHMRSSLAGVLCPLTFWACDFPDPLAQATERDFAFETLRIDRYTARLSVAHQPQQGTYFTALRVPWIWDDEPQVSLTVTARCNSLEALEVARLVLPSVEVAWPGSGLCTGVRPQKCTQLNAVSIRG
jgi:hypothetical protein